MNKFNIIVVVLVFIAGSAFAETVSEDFNYTTKSKVDEFSLGSINGTTTVKSGKTLNVKAVKYAKDKKTLDKIKIDVIENDNTVEIEVEYPKKVKSVDGNKLRVDFDITVPDGVNVLLGQVSGDTTVSGIDLFTGSFVSGNVEISDVYDSLAVAVVSGSVEIVNDDKATRAMAVSTVSGESIISFILPEKKNVFSFETVSGDTEITILGDNLNFSLDAQTVSGSIDANFPVKSDNSFIGGSYSAKVGTGANTISVETVSGSVEINTKESVSSTK